MLKSIVQDKRVLSGDIGQIQIRFSNASEVEVNYSSPAVALHTDN